MKSQSLFSMQKKKKKKKKMKVNDTKRCLLTFGSQHAKCYIGMAPYLLSVIIFFVSIML